MTNHVEEVDGDLEARVVDALHALARQHTPQPRSVVDAAANARVRRRWPLLAAAAIVVVIGAGAILAVTARDAGPVDPSTELPAVTVLRFSEPLADDIVAVLEPLPAGEVTGHRSTWPNQWVSGIEDFRQIAVLEDGAVSGSIIVLDGAMPWDIVSAGQNTFEIGGTDGALLEYDGSSGLFLRRGDATRVVLFGEPTPDDGLTLTPEVGALAELLGAKAFDDFQDTAQFVRVLGPAFDSTDTVYGFGPDVRLILRRVDRVLTERDRSILLGVYRSQFADLDGGAPQHGAAIEQVSPRDLLIVIASTEADARAALTDVALVPESESGVEFSSFQRADQPFARGEAPWGRWEVATSSTEPQCWNFTAVMWAPENGLNGFGSCNEPGRAGEPLPSAFCVRVAEGTVLGVALVSAERIEVDETYEDPIVLQSHEQGETTSFLLDGVADPSGDFSFTVDGERFRC